MNLATKIATIADVPEAPAQFEQTSREVKGTCARLFELAGAERFGVTQEAFEHVLLAVARKYVPEAQGPELIDFLNSLRVEELALAHGCELGNEHAWTTFIHRYRLSLYSAASCIAKDESVGRELADSLYAELFGLSTDGAERRSKLRYYMGRGSLEGWLRTVVAQEFVNRYRKVRNEVSLEEKVEAGAQFAATATEHPVQDSRIGEAVIGALKAADAESRLILAAYYLDGRTLAEVARLLRVHESTISRRIDRVMTALRRDILKRMVAAGMAPRQAQEAIAELDVRDLNINVRQHLEQDSKHDTFYKTETGKETLQ